MDRSCFHWVGPGPGMRVLPILPVVGRDALPPPGPAPRCGEPSDRRNRAGCAAIRRMDPGSKGVTLLVATALMLSSACRPAADARAAPDCPDPGQDSPRVWVLLGGAPNSAAGRSALIGGLVDQLKVLALPAGARVSVLRVVDPSVEQPTPPYRLILPAVPPMPPPLDLREVNAFHQREARTAHDQAVADALACRDVLDRRLAELGRVLADPPEMTRFSNAWTELKSISDEVAGLTDPRGSAIVSLLEDEGEALRYEEAPTYTRTCCHLRGLPVTWLGIWSPSVREEEERRERWTYWLVTVMGAGDVVFVRPGGSVPPLARIHAGGR